MSELSPQQAFATALSIALRVLSVRTLAFVALVMSFALSSWAMWEHTWIAFTVAATFAVLGYLPALWSSRGTPNA